MLCAIDMAHDTPSATQGEISIGSDAIVGDGLLKRRAQLQMKQTGPHSPCPLSHNGYANPITRCKAVLDSSANVHARPGSFRHLPQLFMSLMNPTLPDITHVEEPVVSARSRFWKQQAVAFRSRMKHYNRSLAPDMVVSEASDPALLVAGHRVKNQPDVTTSSVDSELRFDSSMHSTSASVYLRDTTSLGRRRLAECRTLMRGNFVLLSSPAKLHSRNTNTSPAK